MNRDQVAAEILAIIRQTFRCPDAEITRETVALDVDGWDSLSHTTLILEVEKRFGLRLPTDKVYDLADVGELIDLVVQSQGAGG